ncbi:MAG: secretion protein HlyD [Proteobacteria bacterium]|nr:secretion protein HlyD [Pseudomonadota bacterium]
MAIANPRLRNTLVAAAAVMAVVLIAVTVARKRDQGELTLYGNVDIREVTLGFRVAGRLASLAVDEGDVVTAGQELGRLDLTPIQLELDEARANAATSAARLALLRSGYRREDVEQARATVAERLAALTNAEQNLARQQELHGTGAVPARAYDEALAARDQSRARLAAAEQALAELRSGYRQQEIAEADANHARAEASAAQARQRLSDAVLLAPADGVVLTRTVEPGAILAAGSPVFTLSLRNPVWARVYVAEPDLGRVLPGRSVLLYTDSRPGRPYHGQVGFVSPTAEFTPKNVETPELRTALVYRARIVVSDPDPALRQGMPVTVRLEAPAGDSAGAR